MTEEGQCWGSVFLLWLGGGQGVCLGVCTPLHVWWSEPRPPTEQLAKLGLLLQEAALGCSSCGGKTQQDLSKCGAQRLSGAGAGTIVAGALP